MSPFDAMYVDLPGMVLRLAGEAGQVSLARTADEAGARASVDQHASEIRDALTSTGSRITPAALLRCLVEGADEVHVDAQTAQRARQSVQRMIAIGQPGGDE